MSQALIDTLSSTPWTQTKHLTRLVNDSLELDADLQLLRAESQVATENADKVAAAHGIGDPATKAARQFEREARVEQTLRQRDQEQLVEEAFRQGWGDEYVKIRALTAQADKDPMSAWMVNRIFLELGVNVPHDIRDLAQEVDNKLAATLPSYAESLKTVDQAAYEDELVQLARASASRSARYAAEADEAQDSDPRSSAASDQENSIGPGEREPVRSASDQGESAAKRDEEPKAPPAQVDTKTIPAHILENLHRKGTRYVDPSDMKKLVFQDRGDALTTRRDADAASVRAMVDVAQARGWSPLKLAGDEPFRRQAWFEAASRGLEASGYKPTEAEKAVVAKAAEKADGRAPNSVSPGDLAAGNATEASSPTAGPKGSGALPKGARESGSKRAAPAAAAEKRAAVEILVDHGRANFEHREDEKPSYFVTTSRGNKEHTYWGIDLERAVAESGAEKGMPITVKNLGKEPVEVEANVRDKDGKVVGTELRQTHRNTWEITAQVNPQVAAFRSATTEKQREQAAREHPNLANAFAQEAAMKKFAEATIVKADRARFMAEQRKIIERNLADGISLKTVNVRQTPVASKQPPVRVAELEQER